MVVDEGHRHLAPARIGIAVQTVAPVGDAAVLHALLEGEVEHRALGPIGPVLEDLLPAGAVAPVPARVLARRLPQLAEAEAVVVGIAHPAGDPLAGVAADEVEAKAAGTVLAAQLGELVAEHRLVLRVAGVEVGVAVHEAVAVVAVVGMVARVSAVVAPQALAGRQVDLLVRVAAVHMVGYHVVDGFDPGRIERAGGLLEQAVAAVAAVLVEVVPEVALAAARGAVGRVAPAGEVAPGHRHPDRTETIGGQGRRHAGQRRVPVARSTHGIPVKALEDDLVAAVVAHAAGGLAWRVGGTHQIAPGVGQRRQGQGQRGQSQVSVHLEAPFLSLL